MRAAVKFCGLTRLEDARAAARLGAAYAGVIFAGGPRLVTPARAREILGAAGPQVRHVGVFGAATPDEIARVADEASLDLVQLHADPTPDDVRAVRERTGRAVWAVARVAGAELPASLADLFAEADAVLLDARVAGALGGAGVAFDWEAVAGAIGAMRGTTPLVLAGGLTPERVGAAVEALRPAVVDVSSGVEREAGVKDHARMEAFVRALRQPE